MYLQSVTIPPVTRTLHLSTDHPSPAPVPLPGQERLGLTSDRMRCVTGNEFVDVPTNTSRTILDVPGPGCVHEVWLAWGGGQDARLQVFYDGASTPAIDTDVGTLAGTHWAQNLADFWGHEHITVTRNPSGIGVQLRFKMPFSQRITVRLYNPNPGNRLYSMAWYSLGDHGSLRLKASAGRYADGTYKAQVPDFAYDYLDIAGQGWLIGVNFSGGPIGSFPAGWDWLERNIVISSTAKRCPRSPRPGLRISSGPRSTSTFKPTLPRRGSQARPVDTQTSLPI